MTSLRRGYVSGEALLLPSSDSECKLPRALEFIKAFPDTVLEMLNAGYHDKPFNFSLGPYFRRSSVPNIRQ